jgi:hypothetical protein
MNDNDNNNKDESLKTSWRKMWKSPLGFLVFFSWANTLIQMTVGINEFVLGLCLSIALTVYLLKRRTF